MNRFLPLAVLALSGCIAAPAPQPWPTMGAPLAAPEPAPSPAVAARNFGAVVARVEPVAEAECRARLPRETCDFRILVDPSEGAPANAYQTRDETGRPVLAFTVALIGEARNQDELAFVMGHEAAHHILDHIPRSEQTALISGSLIGALAAGLGGDPNAIQAAQRMGATVGARAYSKDYELEADELGTVLAWAAGYDPVRGAAFFARIPDPGSRFLGTHPPNAQRMDVVRRTAAGLR